MSTDALKTLFHPFESGVLPLPIEGTRILFLGAQPAFRLPEGFAGNTFLVQGYRPDFLALEGQGRRVSPRVEGDGFDLALVLCGRHRGENEVRLAQAILRVKPGGLVVMAGDKTAGVAALRVRLEKNEDEIASAISRRKRPTVVIETKDGEILSGPRLSHPLKTTVPLGGHLSKHHGVVFWLHRTLEADAFAVAMKNWYGNWPLVDGRFTTAPGMFSHDRIDPGSRLLAEALPADLSGKIADFCAGWGYLSAEVLARCPGISSIDLYEADFSSLEAARRNLDGARIETRFFWKDLLAEPVETRYDAIVMNPPFHRSRAAEPEIGQKLIAVAANALVNRGTLFLVANRNLPYERALTTSFSEFTQIAGDRAFKVFAARR